MATKNVEDIINHMVLVTRDTASKDVYLLIVKLFLQSIAYELSIKNDVKLRGIGTIKRVKRVGLFNQNITNLKNVNSDGYNDGQSYKNDYVLKFKPSVKFYTAINR